MHRFAPVGTRSLSRPDSGLRPPLDSGSNGTQVCTGSASSAGRPRPSTVPHCGPGNVLDGHGLLVVGQRERQGPTSRRSVASRQVNSVPILRSPGRQHHPEPRPGCQAQNSSVGRGWPSGRTPPARGRMPQPRLVIQGRYRAGARRRRRPWPPRPHGSGPLVPGEPSRPAAHGSHRLALAPLRGLDQSSCPHTRRSAWAAPLAHRPAHRPPAWPHTGAQSSGPPRQRGRRMGTTGGIERSSPCPCQTSSAVPPVGRSCVVRDLERSPEGPLVSDRHTGPQHPRLSGRGDGPPTGILECPRSAPSSRRPSRRPPGPRRAQPVGSRLASADVVAAGVGVDQDRGPLAVRSVTRSRDRGCGLPPRLVPVPVGARGGLWGRSG